MADSLASQAAEVLEAIKDSRAPSIHVSDVKVLCPPPASPPSAEPVGETSSGGERSTAGGAGWCCEDIRSAARWGWIERTSNGHWAWFTTYKPPTLPRGSTVTKSQPVRFCPWCGKKLGET